jgi:hypothetical protein
MRRGDIVKALHRNSSHYGKSVCEGMIVYKKDNDNIGVNFEHYNLAVNHSKKHATQKELLQYLLHFGSDEVFVKSELTLIKKITK